MVARVVSEVEVIARIAAISLPALLGGATGQNGADGAPVGRQKPPPKAPFIFWPVTSQNFGQGDHRAEGGLASDRLMKSLECGPSLGLTHRRQVGVDDRRVQGLVTQVSADLP
jgi:hypothetical protein